MARFVAGLNHEIQDILEYKDYTNITRLFHFPCKAQRKCKVTTQVQRLIFLQEEQIHGSATMYVQPTVFEMLLIAVSGNSRFLRTRLLRVSHTKTW
jgi:hypothetical protein